jgi:hypothetical protein
MASCVLLQEAKARPHLRIRCAANDRHSGCPQRRCQLAQVVCCWLVWVTCQRPPCTLHRAISPQHDRRCVGRGQKSCVAQAWYRVRVAHMLPARKHTGLPHPRQHAPKVAHATSALAAPLMSSASKNACTARSACTSKRAQSVLRDGREQRTHLLCRARSRTWRHPHAPASLQQQHSTHDRTSYQVSMLLPSRARTTSETRAVPTTKGRQQQQSSAHTSSSRWPTLGNAQHTAPSSTPSASVRHCGARE